MLLKDLLQENISLVYVIIKTAMSQVSEINSLYDSVQIFIILSMYWI